MQCVLLRVDGPGARFGPVSGVAGDQRIARLDLLCKGLRGARTGIEVRPVVRRVPAEDADVLATEAEGIGAVN